MMHVFISLESVEYDDQCINNVRRKNNITNVVVVDVVVFSYIIHEFTGIVFVAMKTQL